MEKRLLVIDDDQDIRDLVFEIFKEDGYTVRCLANVDNIFTEISHFHPNVVLVDYKLGGMEYGTEIAYQIKSNAGTMNIPVILFSAHHQRINAIGNFGWDAFVGKPFDVDHIKKVVQRFIKPPVG